MLQHHHLEPIEAGRQAALLGLLAAGGLWDGLRMVAAGGPPWATVPPLLFGLAALVGAVNTFLNDRHRRRDAAATKPAPRPTTTD